MSNLVIFIYIHSPVLIICFITRFNRSFFIFLFFIILSKMNMLLECFMRYNMSIIPNMLNELMIETISNLQMHFIAHYTMFYIWQNEVYIHQIVLRLTLCSIFVKHLWSVQKWLKMLTKNVHRLRKKTKTYSINHYSKLYMLQSVWVILGENKSRKALRTHGEVLIPFYVKFFLSSGVPNHNKAWYFW